MPHEKLGSIDNPQETSAAPEKESSLEADIKSFFQRFDSRVTVEESGGTLKFMLDADYIDHAPGKTHRIAQAMKDNTLFLNVSYLQDSSTLFAIEAQVNDPSRKIKRVEVHVTEK